MAIDAGVYISFAETNRSSGHSLMNMLFAALTEGQPVMSRKAGKEKQSRVYVILTVMIDIFLIGYRRQKKNNQITVAVAKWIMAKLTPLAC